jgi:hypothetical protein
MHIPRSGASPAEHRHLAQETHSVAAGSAEGRARGAGATGARANEDAGRLGVGRELERRSAQQPREHRAGWLPREVVGAHAAELAPAREFVADNDRSDVHAARRHAARRRDGVVARVEAREELEDCAKRGLRGGELLEDVEVRAAAGEHVLVERVLVLACREVQQSRALRGLRRVLRERHKEVLLGRGIHVQEAPQRGPHSARAWEVRLPVPCSRHFDLVIRHSASIKEAVSSADVER